MANNCNNVNQFISYTFDSCNSGSTINLQLNQELKNVTATLVQNIDCNYHTINCSYDNLRQVSYYDILSICGLQLNSDLLITNIATGSTNNSSLATQGYVDDHGGGGGSSAFLYVAYASDNSGTDFTMTFDPALEYIGIKVSALPIPSPSAADFVDLWQKYVGADGREVQLQNNGTYIQWRYVGDISWTNLISIASITGPQGPEGPAGPAGVNYSYSTKTLVQDDWVLNDVSGYYEQTITLTGILSTSYVEVIAPTNRDYYNDYVDNQILLTSVTADTLIFEAIVEPLADIIIEIKYIV